jgi:hypothetical protein
MSMLNLNRPIPERDPKLPDSKALAGAADVVASFEVRKKRIKVDKKRVNAVSKQLSSLAMEMGLTSSPDEFEAMFREDFTAALKKVQQRQEGKKNQ